MFQKYEKERIVSALIAAFDRSNEIVESPRGNGALYHGASVTACKVDIGGRTCRVTVSIDEE